MGLAMYLRYPTPDSASSMAHGIDSAGETPLFSSSCRAQLFFAARVSQVCEDEYHPYE
jgi:hypothetical protein